MPPSQSHLNFRFLMTVLDNNEHITSAALLRLHLRNKTVCVFVSSPCLFSSVQYYLGLSMLINPVITISHSPKPPLSTSPHKITARSLRILPLKAGGLHILLLSHLRSAIYLWLEKPNAHLWGRTKRELHSPSPKFLYPLLSVSQTLECTRIS